MTSFLSLIDEKNNFNKSIKIHVFDSKKNKEKIEENNTILKKSPNKNNIKNCPKPTFKNNIINQKKHSYDSKNYLEKPVSTEIINTMYKINKKTFKKLYDIKRKKDSKNSSILSKNNNTKISNNPNNNSIKKIPIKNSKKTLNLSDSGKYKTTLPKNCYVEISLLDNNSSKKSPENKTEKADTSSQTKKLTTRNINFSCSSYENINEENINNLNPLIHQINISNVKIYKTNNSLFPKNNIEYIESNNLFDNEINKKKQINEKNFIQPSPSIETFFKKGYKSEKTYSNSNDNKKFSEPATKEYGSSMINIINIYNGKSTLKDMRENINSVERKRLFASKSARLQFETKEISFNYCKECSIF